MDGLAGHLGPAPEFWLVLLVVLLYLKDGLLLLRPDEAVLVGGAPGRWRAGFGLRQWKIRGREPYLAPPLQPHLPVIRLAWSMREPLPASGPLASVDPGWRDAALQARRLAPFAWTAWLLLFAVLPVLLLGRWGTAPILAALVLLYLDIAAALVFVWRWRTGLGLSARAVGLLAFECLACAPYAANLVRRVSLGRAVPIDFLQAGATVLAPPAMAGAARQCRARLREAIDAAPEAGTLADQLRAAERRLLAQWPDDDDGALTR